MPNLKHIFTIGILSLTLLPGAHTHRAAAFETVPAWVHVHLLFKGDDGGEPSSKTVDYLKSKGYRGIVFTPHSSTIDFAAYSAEIDALNTEDFIAVAGRENSASGQKLLETRILCHLNELPGVTNPPVLDGVYGIPELPTLIAAMEKNHSMFIWNHPWACDQWKEFSHLFTGIELFNDMGPEYADGTSYRDGKNAYLSAIRKGKRVFVISGIDMHSSAQTALGEWKTYVYPDVFTRESFLAALREGHTVAAFNARVESLNERPSIVDVAVPGGTFTVSGEVAVKTIGGPKPVFAVYRDGEPYTPPAAPTFVKGTRDSKGFTAYTFSFGDTVSKGKTTCYSFEIARYIFSSPYCFKNPD